MSAISMIIDKTEYAGNNNRARKANNYQQQINYANRFAKNNHAKR